MRELLKRFWSLTLVFVLPVLELFAEQFSWYPDSEITRAILSAVCIALLVQSWFMQRKNAKSAGRLTLWTLLLLFLVLEFLWLALNSSRGPNYPVDFTAENRAYWFAVEWQDRIGVLQKIVAAIVAVWIAADLIRWLARRLTGPQQKTGSAVKS
jgi:uncharacterized protein involved in response to NO